MGKKSKGTSKSSKKKNAASRSGSAGASIGRKKSQINPFGDEQSCSNANQNSSTSSPFQSVYQVYKTATLRAKEQLLSLVPAAIFKNDNVQCLLDAADYIKDNEISINGTLLRNLRTAINVRKKYSLRLSDGGDEGHAYFLLVLNYCMQVLKQCKIFDGDFDASCELKDRAEKAKEVEGNKSDNAFFNRFSALSMEDIDAAESDDDEADDTPVARPEPPNNGKAYSTEDMMSFSDKLKCAELFDTMSYHMDRLKITMVKLKETMRMESKGEFPTSRISIELMAIGIMAKEMMLDIDRLENELYIECPDLAESPYCVLAVCFFDSLIKGLFQNVQTYSPLASKFKNADALQFVGDVLQAVFRGKEEETDAISLRFSKKWKLPEQWKMRNRWVTSVITRLTLINVRTDVENDLHQKIEFEDWEKNMQNVPLWISGDEFWKSISGDQSILNTMRLLDMMGSSCANNRDDETVHELMMACILTATKWDGNDNIASKIRGEMDVVLMKFSILFPHTRWMANDDVVPMERPMLPIVYFVRSWVYDGMKMARFSLVFSLHCVLVSLFELQGDGDIARIASIAKERYSNFMKQTVEHLTLDIPCPEEREIGLKAIIETEKLTKVAETFDEEDYPGLVTFGDFDFVFFNPICAGLFLGYNNIYLSLRGGLVTNGASFDLPAVLHLYNALKQRGLVRDDLPLLSDIDTYFDMEKWVWNGWDKPEQGKFVYRWRLSMGATNEIAIYKQDLAHYNYYGGTKPVKPKVSLSKLKQKWKTSIRFSNHIHPEEISDTYKRNCKANFDGIQELLAEDLNAPDHLKVEPSSPLHMPRHIFEAKIYLILLAFTEETMYELKYNMAAAGTIFMQFLYETFNDDYFKEIVSQFEATTDHDGDARSLMNTRITEEILGDLDYNEDNDAFVHLGKSFEDFFNSLDMDRVLMNKIED